MGMSGDYENAILEGATIVRVGTAILAPLAFGRGLSQNQKEKAPMTQYDILVIGAGPPGWLQRCRRPRGRPHPSGGSQRRARRLLAAP